MFTASDCPISPLKVNPGQWCCSLAHVFAGQGSQELWGHWYGSKGVLVVQLGPKTNTTPPEMPTQTQFFVVLLKTKFKTHQSP